MKEAHRSCYRYLCLESWYTALKHSRKNVEWNIADWFICSAKRETITTATVCCVSTAGCCTPPVVTCRRARTYEKLNFEQRQGFLNQNQISVTSAKDLILQHIRQNIMYKPIFLHVMLRVHWRKEWHLFMGP